MVSRYSNTTGKLITVQENYKLELVQRKYTVVVFIMCTSFFRMVVAVVQCKQKFLTLLHSI